jgi:putative MFS transporter
VGRIGSLIGPYAVGVVLPTFGQSGVFSLGACSFALAAVAVATMGIETKGLALEALGRNDAREQDADGYVAALDEAR